jgi:2-hydroxychromene-2-carboxylate isomerase
LWEVAESSEVDEKLIANNERAVARGVFGVPTFFVDDEMFFGNDRLSFVRAKLEPSRTKVSQ